MVLLNRLRLLLGCSEPALFLVVSGKEGEPDSNRQQFRTSWLSGWTCPTTGHWLHLLSDPLPQWKRGARLFLAVPDMSSSVATAGSVSARRVLLVEEVDAGWGLLGAFPRALAFVVLSLLESGWRSDARFADFSGVRLENADLSALDLEAASFADCDLRSGSFSRARLKTADFSRARLDDADFRGADLRGTVFRRASLRRADFHDADLSGAWLDAAILTGAEFSGAKLSGAHLDEANLQGAGFAGAQLGLVYWPRDSSPPFGWELDEEGRLRRPREKA